MLLLHFGIAALSLEPGCECLQSLLAHLCAPGSQTAFIRFVRQEVTIVVTVGHRVAINERVCFTHPSAGDRLCHFRLPHIL